MNSLHFGSLVKSALFVYIHNFCIAHYAENACICNRERILSKTQSFFPILRLKGPLDRFILHLRIVFCISTGNAIYWTYLFFTKCNLCQCLQPKKGCWTKQYCDLRQGILSMLHLSLQIDIEEKIHAWTWSKFGFKYLITAILARRYWDIPKGNDHRDQIANQSHFLQGMKSWQFIARASRDVALDWKFDHKLWIKS